MSPNEPLTIYGLLRRSADRNPSKEYFADVVDDSYRVLTYGDIYQRVRSLSCGLKQLGLQTGDRLAMMIPNGSLWATIDFACAQLGVIDVPIHTTYAFQYVSYTIQHSGAETLIIQDTFYEKFQSQIAELELKRIIVVGRKFSDTIDFETLLTQGSLTEAVEDDNLVHTIIYTSGTTAEPKGVMLSHANIVANIRAASQHIPIEEEDRFFSFLPLSHVLERTGSLYVSTFFGASVYFSESTETIARDIKRAKPTIMLAVPRIFERVYEKIITRVDAGSALKKKMFFLALSLSRKKIKNESLSGSQQLLLRVLDALVLKKVRASLGGRLKYVISGGASLDQKIAKFFQTVGILILEGYGLTECSPIVAVNKSTHYKFGTVGPAIPGTEIRLSSDKEILTKGPSLMRGYYNDEAATGEAIDSDGWFHTGDLGSIDSEGFLTITGRIKEIIVLSNGKNINPVAIEIALNRSIYISQSMVYSPDNKTLKVLLVPNFTELSAWLQGKNIMADPKSELDTPAVKELYAKELEEQLKVLSNFEQVREFKLIAEEFTQDNGLMTPTLKIKRINIIDIYD